MAKGNYYGLKLYNLDDYLYWRGQCIGDKGGALSTQITELNKILNISVFSKRFLKKPQKWFNEKLKESSLLHTKTEFTVEEYSQIVNGYRELARQFNQYADELEKAKMWDDYEQSIKTEKQKT